MTKEIKEHKTDRGVYFVLTVILTALSLIIMLNPRTTKGMLSGTCVCIFFSINYAWCIHKEQSEANPDRRSEKSMNMVRLYAILGALHALAALAVVIFYLVDLPMVSAFIGVAVSVFWTFISLMGYRKEDIKVRMLEEELKR